jgi:glycosyltransferase involved in cell wall biosynthesis
MMSRISLPRVLIVLDTFDLPSSISQALQYRDLFVAAGFDVRYVARDQPEGFRIGNGVANWAWRLKFRGTARSMKASILRRWQDDAIIEAAREFDVVYSLKIPSLRFHERILDLKRPRLLVGFADAFWLPFARRQRWADLERILAVAHGVVTVNEFTAAYIRVRNERVFIVNDSPQTEDFDEYRAVVQRDPSRITLGWIGSPYTAVSLFKIWEPLENLFDEYPDLHLRLVGTGPPDGPNVPRFEKVRWSSRPSYGHEEMIREVLAMDIGLFPLFRGEDSLARGALKAAVYMSGGAAVVAQNYGEMPDLITDGENGMLADSPQEWHDKLALLVRDEGLRREIAVRALETVREKLSRAKTFDQLRYAIENV